MIWGKGQRSTVEGGFIYLSTICIQIQYQDKKAKIPVNNEQTHK
jgi:hypothetical protein